MPASQPVDEKLSFLASAWLEHAPCPMARVEGAEHLVRDTNAAFCRLIDRSHKEMVGQPLQVFLQDSSDCLALADNVYRTGQPGRVQAQDQAGLGPIFSSYAMWPLTTGGRTSGVAIQITESTSPHARIIAMNEALLLGSLRQHELTAIAEEANLRLQAEIVQRTRAERDALMLASEISHRIKNSLQVVVSLIGNEIIKSPPEHAEGYQAMESRITAIADLYDLISQSNELHTIRLDTYLQELGKAMSTSLLDPSLYIKVEVEAVPLEIDADRAVPFGLLVNELSTNAIKHAFPDGVGQVTLSLEAVEDQIELIVADNGVGMAKKDPSSVVGQHGSDYVAIFVRQLGGTMTSRSGQTGTVIRVLFPLLFYP